MTRAAQRGLTLIELMVALLIGMILSLAVFGVMATFEGRRRTLASGADLEQTGAVAMFQMDRWMRSAGSGLPQSYPYAYGCALYAAKSGSAVLPASALPAPFASVNPGTTGLFRLAPVLILPDQTTPGASGQTSDVLVLMAGAAGSGEVVTPFSSAAAAAQLNLANSVPFNANDLILLADQQPGSGGGVSPCLVTQAASSIAGGASGTLALGGSWYAASVDTQSVTGYPDSAAALDLGGATDSRTPSFQLIGVGDNNTLYSYDLLHLSDTPLQARAQGVFELHALYGVDTSGDGRIDAWVKADSGGYTVTALMAGTSTAASLLQTIKAVRVGMILRTALPEREVVNTATTLTLFSDLGSALTLTRTLGSDEQHYRYRTVEATIPLRNNAL